MKAYNTSIHEDMKYTPHKLVFGKTARVPTNSILPDDKNGKSYPEYTTMLFNRIIDAQARENFNRAKIRSKQYYDRKANPQVFKKDDYVYLLKQLTKDKLDKQHTGPYKITVLRKSRCSQTSRTYAGPYLSLCLQLFYDFF